MSSNYSAAGRIIVQNYTYPEFIINEQTGKIKVNLIDKASGRVIRHIPSTELDRIVQGYGSMGNKPLR